MMTESDKNGHMYWSYGDKVKYETNWEINPGKGEKIGDPI